MMPPHSLRALVAAGYLAEDGRPAEGVVLPERIDELDFGAAARLEPIFSTGRGGLSADAVYRVGSAPAVLFKSAEDSLDPAVIAEWHRLAWSYGAAPLLWVTSPSSVRIYNAYQPPIRSPQLETGTEPVPGALLDTISAPDAGLEAALALYARRSVATGAFWRSDIARPINREGRVDSVLLSELRNVLDALIRRGVPSALAQKLVGRCVFFQYLAHRGYFSEQEVAETFGSPRLDTILRNEDQTFRVFEWIRTTFNGDLFPLENESEERAQLGRAQEPLRPLADFFGYVDVSGQGRFFDFRFDAIPIELISSIYETFVHLAVTDGASTDGVHYTPINLVDLLLDSAFHNADPHARVLDPACGSGVFLVESLRRIFWMRSRREPHNRSLVREILYEQLRGVDISPAALSVAAFSLYLALLEVDPDPPRGLTALDRLRFDPLIGRVLFPVSAFDPRLDRALVPPREGYPDRFDVIVGNPPWTYTPPRANDTLPASSAAVFADALSETSDPNLTLSSEEDEDLAKRNGDRYRRLGNHPVPLRSPDWPFLWRVRDFSHRSTHVALILKATPFFSLQSGAIRAREAVLRAFPAPTLVNLSELRQLKLFQEFGRGVDNKQRPNAGPALLFLSNCIPVQSGSVLLMNLPWSSAFGRTGVFELPADPGRSIPLSTCESNPRLVKAGVFGTERDVWFIDRLARNESLIGVLAWCEKIGLAHGQGIQRGNAASGESVEGLPFAESKHHHAGQIVGEMLQFSGKLHRTKVKEQFLGPLVLLPEGKMTGATTYGRYHAVLYQHDLAYNESFYGISFRDRPVVLAKALAAVMHSALVAHQLAMTGGTLGIKQTKVEVVDLRNLLIPRLDEVPGEVLRALAAAYDRLHTSTQQGVRAAISEIDKIVTRAVGLADNENLLLSDIERRASAIFFETPKHRWPMERRPTASELTVYAEQVVDAFNSLATDPHDTILRLESIRWVEPGHASVLIEFALRQGEGVCSDRNDEGLLYEELGGESFLGLAPERSLRLFLRNRLYVIKPAQYRYFSPAVGQSDGDRLLMDIMQISRGGVEATKPA